MKHGSLFSGIGGFDLAAHWMGWENAFHCEWMEFPRKVLDYYFPEADSHVDICKTDFKPYEGNVDIITGGFPCQPFSMAGKRKGSEDERYLWHEMLRAIQEVKPKYVIAENVLGLTNIEDGLVFEQVWSDLEVAGYEVQPFVLPAASKGAPHQRQRIWIIAYRSGLRFNPGRSEQSLSGSSSNGNEGNATDTTSIGLHRQEHEQELGIKRRGEFQFGESPNKRNATDTNCERRNQNDGIGKSKQSNKISTKQNATDTKGIRRTDALAKRELGRQRLGFGDQPPTWDTFPSESPICGTDDGVPRELDGITFSKWRNQSIKGYGNAIVPQVALELFKVIQEIDNQLI
jgi:DNA (cytosine-5)-methyltransferase 1